LFAHAGKNLTAGSLKSNAGGADTEGACSGILGYTEKAVVSTDFRDEECTSVFDAKAGIQLAGTFMKEVSWYDDEWDYSCKVLDPVNVIVG
jgi:glyceraldehyde 3-phosphate dehydrogenase